MKGGKTPIHIMRWAPADYVNDPFVRLLIAEEDFATLAFYHLVLNWSHMEGGELSADPRQLAASLGMRRHRVVRSLQVCVEAGKLLVTGGRLCHPRVVREVKAELSYRAEQAALGRKGGETAGRGRPKLTTGLPLIEDRATPTAPIGPPSPSPTPSPTFVERDGSSRLQPDSPPRPTPETKPPTDEGPPSNGNGQPHDDAPERLDPGGFLDAVKVRLTATVPTELHATWIRPLEAAGWDGDVFVLEAPTQQHRAWCRNNYAARIRDACRELGQDCRVKITVRPREPATLHDGAL